MGRSFNGQDNSLQNYLLRFKSSPTCQYALGACYALVDKLAKLVALQAADAGSIPAESTNKLFLGQPRGQIDVSRAVTESDEGASRTLDSERLLKIYASLAQLVEHLAVNQRVSGSSPEGGANIWRISSEEQNASLSRWRSRVQVPYASPPPLLSYLNTSYTYSHIKQPPFQYPFSFLGFYVQLVYIAGQSSGSSAAS